MQVFPKGGSMSWTTKCLKYSDTAATRYCSRGKIIFCLKQSWLRCYALVDCHWSVLMEMIFLHKVALVIKEAVNKSCELWSECGKSCRFQASEDPGTDTGVLPSVPAQVENWQGFHSIWDWSFHFFRMHRNADWLFSLSSEFLIHLHPSCSQKLSLSLASVARFHIS